jgi:hypothetical protein
MEELVLVPSGFDNRALWNDLLKRWVNFLEVYERMGDSCGDSDLAYWHVEKSLTYPGVLLVAREEWKGH